MNKSLACSVGKKPIKLVESSLTKLINTHHIVSNAPSLRRIRILVILKEAISAKCAFVNNHYNKGYLHL